MEDQRIGRLPSTNLQKSLIVIFSIGVIAIAIALVVIKPTSIDRDQSVSSVDYSQVANKLLLQKDQKFLQVNIDDRIVSLEIARSSQMHQLGLMFRTDLNTNTGMIFVFNSEIPRTFWMKNTLVSLDIIFLDKNFNIVKIHKNTLKNQTDQNYSSDKPAQFVIELPGGNADLLGLREGDNLAEEINASL